MISIKELQDLLEAEQKRQHEGLELIPSENYVSTDVLDALGSVFTNKYSEGYPGRRYYGGQENTDKVEIYAIEAAKNLFKADHANVQPHSGAQANESVYHAWLNPGDTVLAMDLSHGGHLTHGHPVTVLAKQYNFVRYKIKDTETGELDYEELALLADKHKPKIILAGFSSYPRELDYAKFAQIGKDNNAVLMADIAHLAGLIAGKALKNPFDYGFHIMTTTTHKTLRGPRSGMILSKGVASNPLVAIEKTVENIPTLIDRTVFPGVQGGPHMNTILAKAVAFNEALRPEFEVYAHQVIANAKSLADELMKLGIKLVTNGTDNHMMVLDVYKSLKINGLEAEIALDSAGLTVNKNVIPDDPLPPFKPSGIRLGTPAITTRGFVQKDMPQLAIWIVDAMKHRNDPAKLSEIKNQVKELATKLPLPSDKPQ
ncbi:MAG: serine hydroxymethyltransferase [Patescibacteria group bacterium]|jgi:glycine hydroxymethyltransferase|nr:serine hydroxymethyltransferase [Patescibacteria group bacterium]